METTPNAQNNLKEELGCIFEMVEQIEGRAQIFNTSEFTPSPQKQKTEMIGARPKSTKHKRGPSFVFE